MAALTATVNLHDLDLDHVDIRQKVAPDGDVVTVISFGEWTTALTITATTAGQLDLLVETFVAAAAGHRSTFNTRQAVA